MLTIWKFPLRVDDEQTVRMPHDSKVLAAKVQDDTICLWALADTDKATVGVDVPVWIHGTGHEVGMAAIAGRHVDSVLLHGGALVFHVFVGKGF